jgi:pimeloyl-ACP methyl ester carboxylesterase
MTTQPYYPFRSEQAKAEYSAKYLRWAKEWPVPCETKLIDTPSGQTFVRISGSVDNPPLVLLHGARGTSLMWIHCIAALSAHYRTYALETMTDVGFSVPRRKFSTPADLVAWLGEVFRVLAPKEPLNLMGMSYGGWLASLYALRFPDRLRKVVLLAPGTAVLRLSFGFFARVMLISIPLPGLGGSPLRRTLRWLFQDTVRSGEAGRKLIEEDVAEVLSCGRFFVLPRLIWPTVLTDEEWRSFSAPALFLVGENEKIYSAKAAVRRLNRLAPQIKTEIIPGAGHDLTLVKADLVAEKVLEFLRGPAARSIDG